MIFDIFGFFSQSNGNSEGEAAAASSANPSRLSSYELEILKKRYAMRISKTLANFIFF
jgi:hypothetical protein